MNDPVHLLKTETYSEMVFHGIFVSLVQMMILLLFGIIGYLMGGIFG